MTKLAFLFAFFCLWSFRAYALSFTLPDQKKVTLASTPELKERKLSRITLSWPSDSVWSPVQFDAEMPDHKHGMNVKPTAPKRLAADANSYQIDGVKLHMAGLWILRLQVKNTSGELKWIDQTLTLSSR